MGLLKNGFSRVEDPDRDCGRGAAHSCKRKGYPIISGLRMYPLEDEKTFGLLNEARTIGVFQLESDGMRRLCRQMTITNVDEIIALIALYRPGPMDWIPDYIKGKEDPSTIKVPPSPSREQVCEETYGVMVYQEQVMEAARRVAGYSLGGADILRRAMGKKEAGGDGEAERNLCKGSQGDERYYLKRRRMRFSVFWKSLPGMDLINHTPQPME